MAYLVDIVRTVLSRFLLLLIALLCFIPAIIFLFIVPERYRHDNKYFYWFEHFFYVACLKATFLSVTYKGTEHIPHDEPAIIIANHQSSLDIPLLGAMFNCFPHIWLATVDLLDSPIFRFILPRIAVMIDMSTPLKGMKSLIQAIAIINGQRRHVVLFPEGGRFVDGAVHDFYAGFVILAKKTGRPVVPARIFGANKVYPPGAFVMRKNPIVVVVGAAMRIGEDETDEQFKERVYQWFLDTKES
jgi:1-acyl-sn-glycerol-3-phosphate acyltransferase